jgi:SAM-dependent methyltransferase
MKLTEKQELIERYYTLIEKERLYSSKGNLAFHLKHLFKGISFQNRRVIDIGGGTGIFSFYAACRGAKEVVCLEPENEGSLPDRTRIFERIHADLASVHVRHETKTIQSFDPGDSRFDVLLLHNSVNHLNEDACTQIRDSPGARQIYQDIFRKLSSLAARGATLIIGDCSRNNFFALLRVRNPFARHIEWHKHQPPAVWAELLKEVGFVNPEITWICPDQLRSLGQFLLGNRVTSYFVGSHFFLKMEKA